MTKVFAVVVTYNRPLLLQRAVEALLTQTRVPDHIIIVDNASDVPASEVLLPHPIIQIERCKANIGGAGGFHRGLEMAFGQGADVAWMMDDDGLPDSRCLEEMVLAFGTRNLIGHPLVINEAEPSRLAFHIKHASGWITQTDAARRLAKGQTLECSGSPFNGTYIPREVFEKIGNIKRECFIWGDEVEYMYRADTYKIRRETAICAFHHHPANKKFVRSLGPLGKVLIPPEYAANIYYRNLGYVWWRYDKKKFFVKGISYVIRIIYDDGIRGTKNFLDYFLDGASDRYLLHPSREYLSKI